MKADIAIVWTSVVVAGPVPTILLNGRNRRPVLGEIG
jgi:hypothetical protein